jgi:hypothetical protein
VQSAPTSVPSHRNSMLYAVRAISTVLAIVLAANSVALAADPPAPPDPVELKQMLTDRGIGNAVKVTEADGTTVTGTVVAIRGDNFDLDPTGAAQSITIPYAQVSKLENSGMSTATKVGGVANGVLIAAGVFLVVGMLAIFHFIFHSR